MTDQPIPESRVYRHVTCGGETMVSGQSFEVVSNPMSSMERTFCSTCNAMFPIAEYEWVNTKENLADYYARHTENATDMQRFLCSKKFMVGLAAFFAILATVGVYFLVADAGILAMVLSLIAAFVVGAMIGAAIFLNVVEKPIKKKVCGVSDTRMLT